MKILNIAKKFPFPTKDGESIGIVCMLEAIHMAGHELTILAMQTAKHYYDGKLPESLLRLGDWHSVKVDTSISALAIGWALIRNDAFHLTRFFDKGFDKKIVELLKEQEYDLIQIEGLYVCPYIDTIRKHTDAPIVMRSHNAEYEIWERLSQENKGWRNWVYAQIAKGLKREEIINFTKYDALLTVSSTDQDTYDELGYDNPTCLIPTGLNLETYLRFNNQKDQKINSIFHLGALDWIPNQTGLLWFLDHIWPSISKKHPDLVFKIAGRHAPAEFIEKLKRPQVEFLGEVDDAKEFMTSSGIMVVPLLSGSGIRVKIVEAMALGVSLISTEVGAAGIEYKKHKPILIANSPEEFIEQINLCLLNNEIPAEISQNARIYAEEFHSMKKLSAKLDKFYKEEVLC